MKIGKHKKFLKKLTAALLSASLLAGLPWMAFSDATDATVQSYEDQMASLAAKQEQALKDLAAIQESQAEAQAELGKFDELLRYNNEMIKLASGQLDSLHEQILEKEQSISDTAAAIEAQEAAFLDRMVAVYMEEDKDWLEVIFESESLTDFLTKMERINAIFDYDNRIIDNLSANKELLEKDKVALDHAETTQQQRVADYESAITQNQKIYDAKLEYMEDLKTNESDLIGEYSYYRQQEDALNAELEEYLAELAREQERRRQEEERRRQEEERRRQEELAAQQAQQQQQQQWNNTDTWDSWEAQNGYTYQGGAIGWPLDPEAYSYVSSPYGWRVLYGIEEFHLGIDLACAAGTTVRAAEGGTVLRSEYHYSYGNYVLIDHGNGLSTLYAHMSSNAVSVGETVSAGQTIGWVGLTGRTFGYHLHFETRENGSTVNPEGYLW